MHNLKQNYMPTVQAITTKLYRKNVLNLMLFKFRSISCCEMKRGLTPTFKS
jgi:hypothetical protein